MKKGGQSLLRVNKVTSRNKQWLLTSLYQCKEWEGPSYPGLWAQKDKNDLGDATETWIYPLQKR